VNLVTVHDGFTLRDLVSYDTKHNEANGQHNHDGTDDNRSSNSGVEGPTEDPQILDLRRRRSQAMITTLMASFGAPLLLAGDEIGRTQQGNNNAYCQDNEIAWVDWSNIDDDLLAFTKRAVALRARHPVLRRRRYLTGSSADEIEWFTPNGTAMTHRDWSDPNSRCVSVYLDGSDDPDRDEQGALLIDSDLLLLVNGWRESIEFTIPDTRPGATWTIELDSAELTASGPAASVLDNAAPVTVGPWSVLVLGSPPPRVP
jgi:glycogen operon protein